MPWNTRIEEYAYPPETVPEYASILVPSVDNVRTDFLIETIAKQGKVWLVGTCYKEPLKVSPENTKHLAVLERFLLLFRINETRAGHRMLLL